jgi:hypothetical protein
MSDIGVLRWRVARSSASGLSLAGLSVDEFPGDIEVTHVPRILLERVKQDPPEGGWLVWYPEAAIAESVRAAPAARAHDLSTSSR